MHAVAVDPNKGLLVNASSPRQRSTHECMRSRKQEHAQQRLLDLTTGRGGLGYWTWPARDASWALTSTWEAANIESTNGGVYCRLDMGPDGLEPCW